MSEKTYEHELSVEFGGVSIGDETASIGVGFTRDGHGLEQVDAMLCGKRLEVLAVVGAAGNQSQQQFPGMEGQTHPHVEASCDSASLRVTPKQYGSRLRFSMQEIDVRDIAQLSKRNGTLRLNVLGALEDTDDGDETEGTPKPTRQTRLTIPRAGVEPGVDVAATTPIEDLSKFRLDIEGDEYRPITRGKCEALRESVLEIKTIADLEKAMDRDPLWHRKVKGLGEAMIDRLSNSLTAFRNVYAVPVVDETVQGPAYPDRNAPGGEDCDNVAFRLTKQFEDEDCSVTVAVGIVGQTFRSSVLCRVGEDNGGRDTPRQDSEPHDSQSAAARAALLELAESWADSRPQAAERVREWADENWPAEEATTAPADVTF